MSSLIKSSTNLPIGGVFALMDILGVNLAPESLLRGLSEAGKVLTDLFTTETDCLSPESGLMIGIAFDFVGRVNVSCEG